MATGVRDGSYYYSLSITVDGQRKQEYRRFKTAEERDRAYRRRQAEIDEGVGLRLRGDTLSSYLRAWVAGLHDVRASTRYAYGRVIENWIIPHLGAVRLSALRVRDVRAWHGALIARGRAPASVAMAHRILARALGDALREGEVRQNVAKLTRPPSIPRAEMAYWTPAEVTQFVAVVRGHAWAAPFLLMLGTGVRVGECAALRWDDVDLATGSLRVRRTMSRAEDGTRIVGTGPKSDAGRRSIRLDDSTVAVLREQRDRLRFDGSLGVYCFPRDFEDEPLSYNALRYRFRALCKLALVDPIPLHGLRHTYATVLLAGKVGSKTVSTLLGHSTITTTLSTYAHVLDAMEDEAAAVIGQVLGVAK